MRVFCFAPIVCVSAAALAQSGGTGTGVGGGLAFVTLNVHYGLRADPPSSELVRRFDVGSLSRIFRYERSVYSRFAYDNANHVYFGYEVLFDDQNPCAYLVTFGK